MIESPSISYGDLLLFLNYFKNSWLNKSSFFITVFNYKKKLGHNPSYYCTYIVYEILSFKTGNQDKKGSRCYTAGGVPSALETMASICTKASIEIAETPTIVLAGRSPLKNVV